MALAGVGAAVLSVGSGCTGFRAPIVEPLGAKVTGRSDEAVVLGFDFTVKNPNDESMPLPEAVYAVYLDGREVFRGLRSPEATLAPFGSATISLPATVPSDQLPAGATTDYRLDGRLVYIAPGELADTLFDAGLRRPETGLNTTGTVDLTGG